MSISGVNANSKQLAMADEITDIEQWQVAYKGTASTDAVVNQRCCSLLSRCATLKCDEWNLMKFIVRVGYQRVHLTRKIEPLTQYSIVTTNLKTITMIMTMIMTMTIL